MTPDEFKKLWIAERDDLVSFPAQVVASLRIPENSKSFLISPGLPKDAAPFLTFGTQRNYLMQTVSDVWGQPDQFRRYRIIGSNGFGDPICLDEQENGRVVYLNHDDKFAAGFINSSVPQLAYSALLFREAVKQTNVINGSKAFLEGRIPEVVADKFIMDMDLIDRKAIEDGTFWFRSILKEGI